MVSKSTMSHHARILREAGITHSRVQGARRIMTLRRDDLDARFPGLLDAILQPELAEKR
jgi:DNA-binding transcriptional ArsR family regulator